MLPKLQFWQQLKCTRLRCNSPHPSCVVVVVGCCCFGVVPSFINIVVGVGSFENFSGAVRWPWYGNAHCVRFGRRKHWHQWRRGGACACRADLVRVSPLFVSSGVVGFRYPFPMANTIAIINSRISALSLMISVLRFPAHSGAEFSH